MTAEANPAETAIPLELLVDLKKRHGTVHVVVAAGAAVVLRRPTRDEWQRFRKRAMSSKRHLACEELVEACAVYPSATAFQLMLRTAPASAESYFSALFDLAGGDMKPATFTP